VPVFKLLLKEFLTTLCRGVTSGQIFSRRIISGGCHLESYDSVCCVWCSFVLSRFMLYTTLQLSRRIISRGCRLESYDSVCCVWCSFVLSRFMLYTTLQLSVGCINDVLFTNLKSSINFNLNRYVNP